LADLAQKGPKRGILALLADLAQKGPKMGFLALLADLAQKGPKKGPKGGVPETRIFFCKKPEKVRFLA
jgi:hypothetical protein